MLRVKNFDRPLLCKRQSGMEGRVLICIEDTPQECCGCWQISTTPHGIEDETNNWIDDYPAMRYFMSNTWSSIESRSDIEDMLHRGADKSMASHFVADMCGENGRLLANIDFLADYQHIVLRPFETGWKPYKLNVSLRHNHPVITLYFAKTYGCSVEDAWVILDDTIKHICLATPREGRLGVDYWHMDISKDCIIVSQFGDDDMWHVLVQLYRKPENRNSNGAEWQLLHDHFVEDDLDKIKGLLASLFDSVDRTGWFEY